MEAACNWARSEDDFAAVSRRMQSWLDGELRLHVLSPTAIEELTNAPIAGAPEALLFTYRFAPAVPGVSSPGQQPAPPIDGTGYPVRDYSYRRSHDDTRFLKLRVVTRDRVWETPRVVYSGEAAARLLARSFSPSRLDYRGPLFGGDDGLGEYSAATRERKVKYLFATPNDEAGGQERIEVSAQVFLPWYSGPDPGTCSAAVRATLPLPPGGTLWDRLNRILLAGPLRLHGGGLSAPAPAESAAPPAVVDTPESACAAGASEGCYAAALAQIQPMIAKALANKAEPTAAAREWFRLGCDLGHGPSCGGYGQMLGMGASADHASALNAFQRACQLDFGDGCTHVARDAERRGDTAGSRKWFALGCQLGSGAGCYFQARHLERDRAAADGEELARLYDKSCAYGVAPACARYSVAAPARLRDEWPWHIEEGYRLACGAGLPWACNALGLVHADFLNRRVKGASRLNAQQAFDRACSLGDREGCQNKRAFPKGQPLLPLSPPPDDALPGF